ncbi:MAG: AraC family transcriptional regulator [Mesorhizobium sp.]|uniref:helix-turn-helix domain-containing protein n=1 Tax=Mesorhizobium sp. TaxID=1871066 RepID=UPI000FE4603B|nr:helix-turn-helix domain-containing protein [Mesorhizobium sp.]RWI29520.1 MAG: AraC family transcriptional regulator [Mesorhizobium sp.]RWK97542.1 MAG: AraC family transcriptional regulator [Mesorhizobium sp.]
MTSDDNTPVLSGAPILSGAIGEYCEFDPPAALEAHFQCAWSNTLRPCAALQTDGRSLSAVVPDGCVDIIWIDGDLVVAGPDVEVALSTLKPGSTVIGARFRPGAASRWLGLPMSEIVGGRLALNHFWGALAREIAQKIGDASSTVERMRAMQAALCRLAPDVEPPPADMGFAFNALKTESAGPGMEVILDRLDVSPRTLRRRCQEAFGYGPKTLDRILRFQRFLNLARQSAEPRLADLAFEAGYCDQAHLTREVRRLSGFSPATVLRQLGA